MATATLTVADRIAHLSPCLDAKKWAAQYTSPAKAWRECQRGDYMLWLLGRLSGPPESDARRTLVRCAADCAELALPIFEKRHPGDDRVRRCIEACRLWADRKISTEQLREARAAADAAYAAAAYAYAADAAASRQQTYAKCADIVRKHYPTPPRVSAKKPAHL